MGQNPTMPKRLTVSLKRNEALRATTVGVGKTKLVYILVADKKLRYAEGRSRIAYIGTTSRGMLRIAISVAKRAEKIFGIHGVKSFSARIVTCKPRKSVKTWHKLERAFLLSFKETYGDVPWCNTQGKKMKETDEFRYFTRRRIRNVLEELS